MARNLDTSAAHPAVLSRHFRAVVFFRLCRLLLRTRCACAPPASFPRTSRRKRSPRCHLCTTFGSTLSRRLASSSARHSFWRFVFLLVLLPKPGRGLVGLQTSSRTHRRIGPNPRKYNGNSTLRVGVVRMGAKKGGFLVSRLVCEKRVVSLFGFGSCPQEQRHLVCEVKPKSLPSLSARIKDRVQEEDVRPLGSLGSVSFLGIGFLRGRSCLVSSYSN